MTYSEGNNICIRLDVTVLTLNLMQRAVSYFYFSLTKYSLIAQKNFPAMI